MSTGRRRIRTGFALLALAALVALLTSISTLRWFRLQGAAGRFVAVGSGVVSVGVWTATGGPGTPTSGFTSGRIDRMYSPFTWRVRSPNATINAGILGLHRRNGFGIAAAWVEVILWPVPIAIGAGGLLFLRSGRRASLRAAIGLCPTCRYDLCGLEPGSACPECGSKSGGDASQPPSSATDAVPTPSENSSPKSPS